MPTPPTPARLADAISARYTRLAAVPGTLSCGDALERAAPAAGEVVVDLGCGRGRDLVEAALRVGASGSAIGVDANEAMLEAARGAAAALRLDNVRLLRADLAALPLPDACADAVVSSCAVNHAPDKDAVYREVRRVLRPGGRFVVADVVAEEALPRSVRNDPAAWAACYGGAIPEAEYLGAIRTAGFADPEVVARTAPYERGGVKLRSITVKGTKR